MAPRLASSVCLISLLLLSFIHRLSAFLCCVFASLRLGTRYLPLLERFLLAGKAVAHLIPLQVVFILTVVLTDWAFILSCLCDLAGCLGVVRRSSLHFSSKLVVRLLGLVSTCSCLLSVVAQAAASSLSASAQQ